MIRKVTIILVLLGFAAPTFAYEREVQTLSASLADQIQAAGKKSIAVADFTDLQGNVTELGRFLAEEIVTSLAGAGKGFSVVERNNLKVILQEHKLATTGIIDPATARKLGEIVGVDALITGTLTPFGESVRLSLKVLDVSTARVIAASRVDIPKTSGIDELLRKEISAQPPTSAATPRQETKTTKSADADGIRFNLNACKLAETRIVCSFLVANTNEKDVRVTIDPGDRGLALLLFDNAGNQFGVRSVQFGTAIAQGTAFGSAEQQLTPNLPIRTTLTFEIGDNHIDTATLRIHFRTSLSWDMRVIVIRDITIAR